MEAAGVRVPPSSRIYRLHELYHSGIPDIGPQHSAYELAVEGERDLQLLGYAFDQCERVELSDSYRRVLRTIVQDSSLPQADRFESPGRDAAFELLVGAVCKAAQLNPVEWGQPDVTCTWNGAKYAFEAKRLKSVKTLEARVKKATKQIRHSGLPGVIVVDMVLALNPDNHRIRDVSDTVFWSLYEKNVRAVWSEHEAKVQQIIARANVLGIVVHDYHIRRRGSDWQLAGATIRIPSVARASEERRDFETLSALYVYGLPNQTDASQNSFASS